MSKFSALLCACLILSAGPAFAWSPEGYPGSTWGNVGRDMSGFEGNDTMGKVTQGIRWVTLPGKVTVDTYGSYRWRYRTENQRFFESWHEYRIQGQSIQHSLGHLTHALPGHTDRGARLF